MIARGRFVASLMPLGVGIAYFLAAYFSLASAAQPMLIAVLWPAAGIAAGAMAAADRRAVAGIAAAVFSAVILANVVGGHPLHIAAAFAVANTLEALVFTAIFRRLTGGARSLGAAADVGFAALAAAGAAIVGASVGVTGLAAASAASTLSTEAWSTWFAADVTGILAIAPILMTASRWRRGRGGEGAKAGSLAAVFAAGAVAWLVVAAPWTQTSVVGQLPFVSLLPVLLWVGLRCSPPVAAWASGAVAVVFVYATVEGVGFFSPGGRLDDPAAAAQALMTSFGLSALALSLVFEERRRAVRRAAFLLRLDDALRAAPDVRAALTAACDAIGPELGCVLAGISRLEDDGAHARVESEWRAGDTPSTIGRHRLSDYGAGRMAPLLAGMPVLVADARVDPRIASDAERAAYAALGARASIDVPFVRDGAVRGFLFAADARPRAWTAEDVGLAQAVVQRAWFAAERADADAKLRASEARLRLATAAAGMFAWETDHLAGTIAWSDNAAAMLGCRPADLPRDAADSQFFVETADRVRLDAEVADALARRAPTFSSEFRGADGRHWRADGAVAYAEDGAPLSVRGVTRDVTAERRATDALADSEARFRTLAGAVPAILFEGDAEGRNIWVNGQWSEFTGMTAAAAQGDGWLAVVHPDDGPGAFAAWTAAVERGDPYAHRTRYRRRDGAWRWQEVRSVPQRDPSGAIVRWLGSAIDVEDAVAAAQQAEARADEIAAIYAAAPVGLCVFDRELRYVRINDRLAAINGRPAADHIGRTAGEVVPDLAPQAAATLARVLAGEEVRGVAFTGVTPAQPGVVRTWRENWLPLRDRSGAIVGVTVSAEDVTAAREAELALADAKARLDRVLALTATGIIEVDAQGRMIYANAAAERMAGISALPEEARKFDAPAWGIETADGAPIALRDLPAARALRGEAVAGFEHTVVNAATGERRVVTVAATPVRDAEGRVTGAVTSVVDITEQRAARQAVLDSESRYRAVFEQAGVGVARVSPDGPFLEINDRYCQILGRSREELVGGGWKEITHADDLAEDVERVNRLLRGEADSFTMEKRYLGKEGAAIWVNLTVALVRGAGGAPLFFVAVAEDIARRKQAEAALEDLNRRLARRVADALAEREAALADRDRTWNNARDLLLVVGTNGVLRAVNPAWAAILGWRADELVGRSYLDFIHPDDHLSSEGALATAAERALPVYENRYRHKDGSYRWISWVAAPEGELIYASGRDVTAEKARQAELDAARAQMHEMQKLETIGQLTGGVAHDFNNLLTPIVGGLDLLMRRGLGSERDQRLLKGAMDSAERAKTLVQRLLAFARRAPLVSGPVDAGALLEGMRELIERSVGPAIALEVEIAPDLPPARVDSNQLELALLNLAINARDAMPGGGRLTVRAERGRVDEHVGAGPLAPGDYVRVSVSDTGMGMDAETLRRCIEPFYTSKGVGRGTGLGLSMVHGLCAQSGGRLVIASTPGEGTTAEMWLPVAQGAATSVDASDRRAAPTDRRGAVLLVDDEELVRDSTAAMLAELGYDVRQVDSATEALNLLCSGERVDVLVTDHLMPGMTGLELAREARALYPDLPALIITGYSRTDEIGEEFPRLDKPFRQIDLADRIEAISAPQDRVARLPARATG